MSAKITYLITGANRGLGLGMTRSLLLRPNTLVIATIRSPSISKSDLENIDVAQGSKLLICHYSPDEGSLYTAGELIRSILGHGIQEIDIVIANLGIGTDFLSCTETNTSSLLEHFTINTLAPILLFQALKPYFPTSPTSTGATKAKFILISSALGSITGIERGKTPYLAYGISKAASNFFVRKVHGEEEGLVTLAVHPGWVKTENGQNFADAVGVETPPMSVEQSVEGVLKQVDMAKKETTSGCFVGWDSVVIPW